MSDKKWNCFFIQIAIFPCLLKFDTDMRSWTSFNEKWNVSASHYHHHHYYYYENKAQTQKQMLTQQSSLPANIDRAKERSSVCVKERLSELNRRLFFSRSCSLNDSDFDAPNSIYYAGIIIFGLYCATKCVEWHLTKFIMHCFQLWNGWLFRSHHNTSEHKYKHKHQHQHLSHTYTRT